MFDSSIRASFVQDLINSQAISDKAVITYDTTAKEYVATTKGWLYSKCSFSSEEHKNVTTQAYDKAKEEIKSQYSSKLTDLDNKILDQTVSSIIFTKKDLKNLEKSVKDLHEKREAQKTVSREVAQFLQNTAKEISQKKITEEAPGRLYGTTTTTRSPTLEERKRFLKEAFETKKSKLTKEAQEIYETYKNTLIDNFVNELTQNKNRVGTTSRVDLANQFDVDSAQQSLLREIQPQLGFKPKEEGKQKLESQTFNEADKTMSSLSVDAGQADDQLTSRVIEEVSKFVRKDEAIATLLNNKNRNNSDNQTLNMKIRNKLREDGLNEEAQHFLQLRNAKQYVINIIVGGGMEDKNS